MDKYSIFNISDKPQLKNRAAAWFHDKWNVPLQAYLDSIDDCLKGSDVVPRWYLATIGDKIIAGLGVIENDFHDRKDLTPNVCAVYVEEEYRRRGIAGDMLQFVCDDMKSNGVSTLYLLTDHTGFYERYGWRFLCPVQGDGEADMSRMYVHTQEKADIIMQTERLILRKMTQEDYAPLCKIMQDSDVMYAYEGSFSDNETAQWLDKQLLRYDRDGIGLYAVVLKQTGEMIGQCGLSVQEIPGEKVIEIGYLFQKAFWHKGFASEAAAACREYAFNTLKADEVFAIIRDSNLASQNVARRIGMTVHSSFVKHYRGADMPHYVYSIKARKVEK